MKKKTAKKHELKLQTYKCRIVSLRVKKLVNNIVISRYKMEFTDKKGNKFIKAFIG